MSKSSEIWANLTPGSARTTFNLIKRKLTALGEAAATNVATNGSSSNDDDTNDGSNPSTPKANGTSHADANIPPGHATAGAQSDRPKKTPRKRKVKADGANANGANGDGGGANSSTVNGDGSPIPKKRGRKSKADKEREAAAASAPVAGPSNSNTNSITSPTKSTKSKNPKGINGNHGRPVSNDEENANRDIGIGSSRGGGGVVEFDENGDLTANRKNNSATKGRLNTAGKNIKGKGKQLASSADKMELESHGNDYGDGPDHDEVPCFDDAADHDNDHADDVDNDDGNDDDEDDDENNDNGDENNQNGGDLEME